MSLPSTLRFIAAHPLNRHRKAQAVLQYLKWQIGSRLVPGQVVCDWVGGARLLARTGETGVTGNIYCGLHEFADMAYVLHATAPGDLFVDIGANVGAYTILACAARGARGYCFEPVPATYRRLLDNIRLNALGERVTALNIGLADRPGQLSFTADEDTTNHVVTATDSHDNVINVEVGTLDDVLRGASPALMKIDVEGFELPVIRGAHATLSNSALHSVVMELNGSGRRYGFDEAEIVSLMHGYGFRAHSYEPFERRLIPRADAAPATANILFVRNVHHVAGRIAAAPRFAIGGTQI